VSSDLKLRGSDQRKQQCSDSRQFGVLDYEVNTRTKQIHSRESDRETDKSWYSRYHYTPWMGTMVWELKRSCWVIHTRQSYDVESRKRARSCGISRVSSSSSEASFNLILPVFIILIAQIHYLWSGSAPEEKTNFLSFLLHSSTLSLCSSRYVSRRRDKFPSTSAQGSKANQEVKALQNTMPMLPSPQKN
jgi:hypothetical protein